MQITRFDHITVAVADIEAATEKFSRCLNLQPKDRRRVKHLGMENVFLPVGDGAIELVTPLKEPETPKQVERFLKRKGEGMMLLCLTVEDIDLALTHLKECGVRVIEDRDADGEKIALIHPKDMFGLMIELRVGKRKIRE
jgi:methylmalonyl-CoA/ethylmalonyl-CoA epimerase